MVALWPNATLRSRAARRLKIRYSSPEAGEEKALWPKSDPEVENSPAAEKIHIVARRLEKRPCSQE
jgi:hypothetical protein